MGAIGRGLAAFVARPALLSTLLIASGVALAASEASFQPPASGGPARVLEAAPTPAPAPFDLAEPTPDPTPAPPVCTDPIQARSEARARVSAGLAERREALDEIRAQARWASTVVQLNDADAMLLDLAAKADSFLASMPCEEAARGVDAVADRSVAAMVTVGELARSLLAAERTPTPTARVVAASSRKQQVQQPVRKWVQPTPRPTPRPTPTPTRWRRP